MDDLTQEVLRAQKEGGAARQRAKDRIGLLVYAWPRKTARWDLDQCANFYLYFEPRIERLIDGFRDKGRPFENLLHTCLKWQMLSWSRRQAEEGALLTAAESHQVYLDQTGEPSWPSGDRPDPDQRPPLEDFFQAKQQADHGSLSPANARRLLLLTCKCAAFVDDRLEGQIAHRLGLDRVWLSSLLAKVRDRLDDRLQKQRRLEQLRAEAWSRRQQALKLQALDPSPSEAARWTRLAGFYARRLDNATKALASHSVSPTNAELAELFHLPKGTVDSGLFHLKKQFSALPSASGNQYS